jgi:hypothetical protein
MAGRDENTYGFRKDDADALINMIGMGEVETPGRRLGGGGGAAADTLFSFSLSANLSSGIASASIYEMAPTAVGDFVETSSVRDHLHIFEDLLSGDTGLCIKQGGYYYVIQANCPTPPEP